jgi:protein-serine/threonine kinase
VFITYSTCCSVHATIILPQVDKRGLPTPSSLPSSGGMLKGLLLRRGSSQVTTPLMSPTGETPSTATSSSLGSPSGSPDPSVHLPNAVGEAVYGDRTIDQGDEVRFSVELTRIDRLDDTYSLDVRRLKGNLRSYKFLYDTLREYVLIPCLLNPRAHYCFTLLRRCVFPR